MNERIAKLYDQAIVVEDGGDFVTGELDPEKFAELILADEREKVAQWMIERGFATGHGDSIEDLLKEIEWQIESRTKQAYCDGLENGLDAEREACAKICDAADKSTHPAELADAIRARSLK